MMRQSGVVSYQMLLITRLSTSLVHCLFFLGRCTQLSYAQDTPDRSDQSAYSKKHSTSVDGGDTGAEDLGKWRFAPLPSVAYNIERGIGYGAYLTAFKKYKVPTGERGARYEYSISLALFQTTKGYQYHKFLFDAPYLTKDRLRLQGILGYEAQDMSWYSGVGSPVALVETAIKEKRYIHPLQSLWFIPNLTQALTSISPHLLLSFGWVGRYVFIETPSESLISEERPRGVEGGFLSSAQLSLSWDSRDREPDTEQGVWTEFSARGAHQMIGSDWSYFALNFTHRHYVKLSNQPWFVYAYRLGLDGQIGEQPFFQRGVMGGVQWTELGGNSVLRSYKFGRFRGDQSLYLSQELRGRVWRLFYKNRPIDLLLCPLLDLGVIRGINEVSRAPIAKSIGRGIWGSAGLGGRAVYDEGFVVRVDVMWALERVQETSASPARRRSQLGIFAMTGHSF